MTKRPTLHVKMENPEKRTAEPEYWKFRGRPSSNNGRIGVPQVSRIHVDTVSISSRLGDPAQDPEEYWPGTARFETIGCNLPDESLSQKARKVIEMGLMPENEICCNCTEPCMLNKKCKCYQLAYELSKRYNGHVMTRGKPWNIVNDEYKTQYWDEVKFVCGAKCRCPTCCELRALDGIDKNHDRKFEVVRKDLKGFCVFSKVDFQINTPVLSFNGMISSPNACKDGTTAQLYSIQLTGRDEYHNHQDSIVNVASLADLEKEFRNLAKYVLRGTLYINPLEKGNIGRFISHSCEPNLEIVRVVEGGVTPANIRIVFVTTRPIQRWDELTFNYGPDYVTNHLGGNCLCIKCLREKKQAENPEQDENVPPRARQLRSKKEF